MVGEPAVIGRTKTLVALGVLTMLALGASTAAAQGVGVRAGVSGDPEQFYVGVHAETGPVVESLWFRPNLEIGVGDDRTLVGVNVEFAWRLPLNGTQWRMYVGGGPALNLTRRRGNTDAGGGLNILVGVEHRDGFFTELKVGAIDSPSVKFGVGYTFRR
jgi:hypothetical protein